LCSYPPWMAHLQSFITQISALVTAPVQVSAERPAFLLDRR
jgi:hypothetical protein